jgi:hypothetical protein
LLTVMCGLLLAGVWRDDHVIDTDPVTTPAEVIYSSVNRVEVLYTAVVPPNVRRSNLKSSGGVADWITVGLPQRGDGVMVEYARSNPEIVRVAGRGFAWSALRGAVLLTVVWALLAGFRAVLWRRRRR